MKVREKTLTVRTDYALRREMGQQLRDAIVEYINHGAKTWLGGGEDHTEPIQPDMWDMVKTDADDLVVIASLIDSRKDEDYNYSQRRELNEKDWDFSAAKDVQQAFMAASDLDTAVRDVIPVEVWNWMSTVYAQSK